MSDSRQAVIDAAQKYLFQGLLQHQPDLVPFADDAVRIELGMVSGASGAQLRELLRSDAYLAVQSIDALRWIVEGEQAVCFYQQKIAFGTEPLLVCTRFRVVAGLIKEIEILLYGKGVTETIAEGVAALSQH
jgi:hypothetical protein